MSTQTQSIARLPATCLVSGSCTLQLKYVIEVVLKISRGHYDESESDIHTLSLGSCEDDEVADNCVGRCTHAYKSSVVHQI